MIYRQFISSDADQVYEVAKKSWENTYRDIFSFEFINNFVNRAYKPDNLRNTISRIEDGWTGFWVAEDGNRVIGFAQVGYSSSEMEKGDPENEVYLYRIYIDPAYLGKGIGSRLLQLVENWVKRENKNHYCCFCHKDNTLGKQFYLKKKFEHTSNRDNLAENEIFLVKKIK